MIHGGVESSHDGATCAPARAVPTIPIVCCPECPALDAAGYVGNTTGDLVLQPARVWADEQGNPYCHSCGVVWRGLSVVADPGPDDQPEPPRGADVSPNFDPSDGGLARGTWRKLARIQRKANVAASGTTRAAQTRAADRLVDAEALCNVLDLPPAVREAIAHHVLLLNTRADMRALCNVRRSDGRIRAVRSEAVTVAVVSLVMERFGLERPGALDAMLGAFGFTKGDPAITAEEYRAAYHSTAGWLDAHVWRRT